MIQVCINSFYLDKWVYWKFFTEMHLLIGFVWVSYLIKTKSLAVLLYKGYWSVVLQLSIASLKWLVYWNYTLGRFTEGNLKEIRHCIAYRKKLLTNLISIYGWVYHYFDAAQVIKILVNSIRLIINVRQVFWKRPGFLFQTADNVQYYSKLFTVQKWCCCFWIGNHSSQCW